VLNEGVMEETVNSGEQWCNHKNINSSNSDIYNTNSIIKAERDMRRKVGPIAIALCHRGVAGRMENYWPQDCGW